MSTKKTKPAAADAAAEATKAEPPAKATQVARGGKGGKTGEKPAQAPKPRQKPTRAVGEPKPERKPRANTKQAQLIAMLQAKEGVTVADIAKAFGWQAHTVRGALYGALKTKLKLDVVSEKVEGRGRVYRIGS